MMSFLDAMRRKEKKIELVKMTKAQILQKLLLLKAYNPQSCSRAIERKKVQKSFPFLFCVSSFVLRKELFVFFLCYKIAVKKFWQNCI